MIRQQFRDITALREDQIPFEQLRVLVAIAEQLERIADRMEAVESHQTFRDNVALYTPSKEE